MSSSNSTLLSLVTFTCICFFYELSVIFLTLCPFCSFQILWALALLLRSSLVRAGLHKLGNSSRASFPPPRIWRSPLACTRCTKTLLRPFLRLCRMPPSTYGHGRNPPPTMVLGWPSPPSNPCTRKWIFLTARRVCPRPTIMARRMIQRRYGLPWRDTIKEIGRASCRERVLRLV